MGAYWHLSLPLEICIDNKQKSLDAFQQKYGLDYVFVKNDKSSEKIELSDGFKFTRTIDKNSYILNNELYIQEIKPLYKELIETYINMFQEYEMPYILYEKDTREELFNGLDTLDLKTISDAPKIWEEFSETKGRYVTSYSGWIPQKVVYEGYPLDTEDDSSEMNFITFFHSNFKIGEYHKEFGQIYCFYETVRKTLNKKYNLAQYLALIGY